MNRALKSRNRNYLRDDKLVQLAELHDLAAHTEVSNEGLVQ